MASDKATRLLDLLTTTTTSYETLADELAVSVSRVQDYAAELRNEGHKIITDQGEGYRLAGDSDIEPDPSELTNREEYLVKQLQKLARFVACHTHTVHRYP